MREWWAKLRAAFRRNGLDAELREEIDAHLRMELESHIETGASPGDALARARRSFGNTTRIRESAREAWTFAGVETFWQDVRYGLRVMGRSRGFALTAVLVIALGAGAATAAFTLLDHVLLRPLPFHDPDRLVLLHQTDLADGGSRELVSAANLVDWRAMSGSFESMGAYMAAFVPVNLSGHGSPMRLDTTLADADLFRTLGVEPVAGRLFTADDESAGAADVVLISHDLAAALFDRAQSAVGRSVRLDNRLHTIVGVMPPGFAFPRPGTALWRPLRLTPAWLANRSNHVLFAIGRLRPGISLNDARSEIEVVAARLRRAYPKDNAEAGIAVVDLRGLMSPESRTLVIAVFGAAFCLLLIACTNLAGLLVARAAARTHEMAVRTAVGAARTRLVRQLITESLLLAAAGGALGAMLAVFATPFLGRLVPGGLPLDVVPAVDVRVLAFATLLTVATSIAFSVWPALRSTRHFDAHPLRSSSRVTATDYLRASLILAEVAGSVTLLIAAGLLAKALWRVQAIDPGFQTQGVLTLRTALPMPKYANRVVRQHFYTRVLTEIRALSGVTSASYASYQPMEPFSGRFEVLVPGVADDPRTAPSAVILFVTPDFFATLRIPLRAGRSFLESDDAASPPVAIVSESLAAQLWPERDPLGRHVRVAGERTVIGVAGDIAVRTLEGDTGHEIYFPFDQLGNTNTYYAPKDLLIRASSDPTALVPAVRRIIHDTDPEQAVSNIQLLEDVVASQTVPRRDQLVVVGVFSGLAFLLAAVGIHGLLAFTVSARTQELGIRTALGASRADILGMFLRQGLTLGAAGVLAALPLAYAAASGLRALLFGVPPGDPLTYVFAALFAMVVTIAGSLRPAIRATTIDPVTAIRAE